MIGSNRNSYASLLMVRIISRKKVRILSCSPSGQPHRGAVSNLSHLRDVMSITNSVTMSTDVGTQLMFITIMGCINVSTHTPHTKESTHT